MKTLGLLRHHLLYGLLEKNVKLTTLGSPCAWNFSAEGLNPDSAIVCAGGGGDISFEMELHRTTGAKVILLDPSPTGKETVAKIQPGDLAGIEYLTVGLAARSGPQVFSLPIDPTEGSYAVEREGAETITFECVSLQDLMRSHGFQKIDLLKMDIEGFEWDILEDILAQSLPVSQICVELHCMHGRYRSGLQRYLMVLKMWQHGYRLINHQGIGDHTFLRVGEHTSH